MNNQVPFNPNDFDAFEQELNGYSPASPPPHAAHPAQAPSPANAGYQNNTPNRVAPVPPAPQRQGNNYGPPQQTRYEEPLPQNYQARSTPPQQYQNTSREPGFQPAPRPATNHFDIYLYLDNRGKEKAKVKLNDLGKDYLFALGCPEQVVRMIDGLTVAMFDDQLRVIREQNLYFRRKAGMGWWAKPREDTGYPANGNGNNNGNGNGGYNGQ